MVKVLLQVGHEQSINGLGSEAGDGTFGIDCGIEIVLDVDIFPKVFPSNPSVKLSLVCDFSHATKSHLVIAVSNSVGATGALCTLQIEFVYGKLPTNPA